MTWFHSKERQERLLEENNKHLLLIIKNQHKMEGKLLELQTQLTNLGADYETLKKQNAAIIQALKDKGTSDADIQTLIDSAATLDKEVKDDTAAGAGDAGNGGVAQNTAQS